MTNGRSPDSVMNGCGPARLSPCSTSLRRRRGAFQASVCVSRGGMVGSKSILVIMFVTYVAREAALRPRVSMQSHGEMQNFLVYARHVRHTSARWYGASHVRGQEEGRCFQTEDTSQMRTRPGRSR
jgi:hypothetical protein